MCLELVPFPREHYSYQEQGLGAKTAVPEANQTLIPLSRQTKEHKPVP